MDSHLLRFTRKYAKLTIAALCLGCIPNHYVSADCGCSDCGAAACSTCDTGCATPRICGLGNGLLDYLDKASGRMEANFFRLRGCRCSTASNCDTGCDGCGGEMDLSSMAGEIYESPGSLSQNHSGHSHQHSSQPSYGSGHSNFNHNGSNESLNESPVPMPMPIPDPIASPPSSLQPSIPAPRKPGNPFMDEARFHLKDDFVAPIRTASSSSKMTVAKMELSVAKIDVKPVPKHLLRPKSIDKLIDGTENLVDSQVIPAASTQHTQALQVQFAR